MSTDYIRGCEVPTPILCKRLRELSSVIARGSPSTMNREFDMRVPCEVDRDADCVIMEAAIRIEMLEKDLKHKNILITIYKENEKEYETRLQGVED